jgi:RNA polymerase sigma-70 factor (ECF subfamily)
MKSNHPELLITKAIINGDRNSFDKFYSSEYKRALFYVNQYIHDITIAEDITQESFVSLWEKRSYLDPDFPLLPYLYSILKNRSLNQLRKLANDQRVRNEWLKNEYKANITALTDESADIVIKFQLEEYIGEAFRDLPDKICDSFIQSRINGLSYQEIAKKKGVSVKVVEYHVSQALKLFRNKLKDFL